MEFYIFLKATSQEMIIGKWICTQPCVSKINQQLMFQRKLHGNQVFHYGWVIQHNADILNCQRLGLFFIIRATVSPKGAFTKGRL